MLSKNPKLVNSHIKAHKSCQEFESRDANSFAKAQSICEITNVSFNTAQKLEPKEHLVAMNKVIPMHKNW